MNFEGTETSHDGASPITNSVLDGQGKDHVMGTSPASKAVVTKPNEGLITKLETELARAQADVSELKLMVTETAKTIGTLHMRLRGIKADEDHRGSEGRRWWAIQGAHDYLMHRGGRWATASQIKRSVGFSTNASVILGELVRLGVVDRTGTGTATRYRVAPQ